MSDETETTNNDNVVDIGKARAQRQTKGQALLQLLHGLPIRRTSEGRLVILRDDHATALESSEGIKFVRSEYGKKYGDSVTVATVKDAVAAFASTEVPSMETGTKVDEQKDRLAQADVLVELAKSQCELFHDDQDVAYVSYFEKEKRETVKLRSSRFRSWLEQKYFKTEKRVPGGQAKSDALGVLEGLAVHDGPLQKISIRVGERDSVVYVDLCDEARTIVAVTTTGWSVVTDAPVRFIRPKGLAALPIPVTGGTVAQLRPFLNVKSDAQFVLVVAWIVAAMKARGPFPILNFIAEHGGGKTSASRFVRALVDPNVSPVRSAPRELRDLAVAATSAHVLGYDNLSGVAVWLSDGLCRVSTGGGFAARALYSDAEEQIFDFVRPIILNGIDDIAERADLADRCLLVRLPPIEKSKRRREKALWREFDLAKPGIFGAILTGVSGALAREDSIVMEELPRMADFVIFAIAAEEALGWKRGTFMSAYEQNIADAATLAHEADAVSVAIVNFMADNGEPPFGDNDMRRPRAEWLGTATELLNELSSLVGEEKRKSKEWPKAANALSNRLRRAAPGLRKVGVEIDLDRHENSRLIRVWCEVAKSSSSSSSSSVQAKNSHERHDDHADLDRHAKAPSSSLAHGHDGPDDHAETLVDPISPSSSCENSGKYAGNDGPDGPDDDFRTSSNGHDERDNCFSDLLNGVTS